MFVRYDIKRSDGTTRREYNEDFGQPAPEVEIPEDLSHLWEWYFDVNQSVNRIVDGSAVPISLFDWAQWQKFTGNVVTPQEFDILRAMDAAFIETMNAEIEAERKKAEAK